MNLHGISNRKSKSVFWCQWNKTGANQLKINQWLAKNLLKFMDLMCRNDLYLNNISHRNRNKAELKSFRAWILNLTKKLSRSFWNFKVWIVRSRYNFLTNKSFGDHFCQSFVFLNFRMLTTPKSSLNEEMLQLVFLQLLFWKCVNKSERK